MEKTISDSKVSKVITPIALLRRKMRTPEAFDNAISQGLIEQHPSGKLISHFGTHVELAYFLGTLFCGDYATKHIWCKGEYRYPDKELRRLFDFSVRTTRENRIGTEIPYYLTYINNLF